MPVMDGYETARRLRELEKQGGRKRCKIVAISSNDERSIVERALGAGCDDYLVKPAPREALWQLLSGSSIKNSLEKEQAALPSDPVVVDADLKDTLAAFLESRRKALDEMPAALTKGDRPRFKRLAHRLAGSFALYGFAWASAQCRALESHSTGAPVAELLARVQAVRSHLGEAKVRFEKRPSPQAAV
jgi:CheY-like chemotaxis protein